MLAIPSLKRIWKIVVLGRVLLVMHWIEAVEVAAGILMTWMMKSMMAVVTRAKELLQMTSIDEKRRHQEDVSILQHTEGEIGVRGSKTFT